MSPVLIAAFALFAVWLVVMFWPRRRDRRTQYRRFWSGQKMGTVESRIEYE